MCYPQPDGRTLVVWTKWQKNPDPNPLGAKNRKPYACATEVVSATFSFSAGDFEVEYAKYGMSEHDYGNAWVLYGREV